jgi:hypothetical protein
LKQLWQAFLHHIHFRPACIAGEWLQAGLVVVANTTSAPAMPVVTAGYFFYNVDSSLFKIFLWQ